MSIQKRISKAERDLSEGDYENALLQALIAVAATSQKRYPNQPDKVRFEKFLQDDFFKKIQPNISILAPVKIAYRGNMETFEHILYKFIRCNLIHEAEVAPDIIFLDVGGFVVDWTGSGLALSYGAVETLIRVVREAPENAGIFTGV